MHNNCAGSQGLALWSPRLPANFTCGELETHKLKLKWYQVCFWTWYRPRASALALCKKRRLEEAANDCAPWAPAYHKHRTLQVSATPCRPRSVGDLEAPISSKRQALQLVGADACGEAQRRPKADPPAIPEVADALHGHQRHACDA